MIYFIKSERYVKIGYSANPIKRVAQLKVSIPYHIKVVCIISGGLSDERNLHKKFMSSHYRGEWFHLSEEIVDYMDNAKNLMWQMGFDEEGISDLYEINPLKALRLSKGYSLEEAADKMGVTKQSLREAEIRCFQGKITINALARYGKAIGGKLQYRFKQG